MLMPTVAHYMTRQPWTVRKGAQLSDAHRIMREHHVRHLPVLDGGNIVGILSERDLGLFESLPGSDPDETTVEDVMVQDVYTVAPDVPLDEVVDHMAEHKLGSAVVLDRRGKVEGIFTTIDALQFFGEVLRRVTA